MRRPRPTPRRRPSSTNTGSRPPSRPVHRWRGFTVSPVMARRPQEGETWLLRVQSPVEAARPQTSSSTKATKADMPLRSAPTSQIAPARWRNCRSIRPSRGPGTLRESVVSLVASSSSPPWRSRSHPGSPGGPPRCSGFTASRQCECGGQSAIPPSIRDIARLNAPTGRCPVPANRSTHTPCTGNASAYSPRARSPLNDQPDQDVGIKPAHASAVPWTECLRPNRPRAGVPGVHGTQPREFPVTSTSTPVGRSPRLRSRTTRASSQTPTRAGGGYAPAPTPALGRQASSRFAPRLRCPAMQRLPIVVSVTVPTQRTDIVQVYPPHSDRPISLAGSSATTRIGLPA